MRNWKNRIWPVRFPRGFTDAYLSGRKPSANVRELDRPDAELEKQDLAGPVPQRIYGRLS